MTFLLHLSPGCWYYRPESLYLAEPFPFFFLVLGIKHRTLLILGRQGLYHWAISLAIANISENIDKMKFIKGIIAVNILVRVSKACLLFFNHCWEIEVLVVLLFNFMCTQDTLTSTLVHPYIHTDFSKVLHFLCMFLSVFRNPQRSEEVSEQALDLLELEL